MQRLFYQFPGTWFGDCMPWAHNGEFYLFHQRDNRNPCPFGEPFGWSLAVTKDFVHYEDKGIAIPGGTDEEQDQFIFAGSVFEAEGSFHAIYTGYNRDYEAQGKNPQVLMHAVSSDLVHWEKTGEGLTILPQPGYDPGDWRDPFVMWDEENGHYLLVLGTRLSGPKSAQTGRTVYFTSKDLKEWKFGGDFWAPQLYTMHEMPDLFQMGDWWYHIISEYSDRNKMVYRMSHSLYGPWQAPEDDAFDGRAYYAARTCCLDGQRILFGWVPTREGEKDTGNFEWAGTFVPHEVYQRRDDSLGVRPPESLWDGLGEKKEHAGFALGCADGRIQKTLTETGGTLFGLEAVIRPERETREFGIRFYADKESGQGYQYRFLPGEKRVIFEKYPNSPWYACMNIGLERPIC